MTFMLNRASFERALPSVSFVSAESFDSADVTIIKYNLFIA
jgi:hypothetical protein